MGRHSAPEQGPFYRSFVAWFLPWIVLAVIAAVAVWLAVDLLGGDEVDASRPAAGASPTEAEPSPEPSASPTPEETPDPVETPPEEEPEKDKPLITEGITVQVLNATRDPDVDDALADELTELGFTIVAVEDATGAYEKTTVFYSYPEAEKAAKRLADRFDWDVDEKPANLADTVALHVVVGNDRL